MKKIYVLGISGSPRKRGNSEFLLEHALRGAKEVDPKNIETKIVSLAELRILPCISCFKCKDIKGCIIKDDFHKIEKEWIKADAVIYSFPVYHFSVPAQLKAFIDRLGNSTLQKYKVSGSYQVPKFMKVIGAIAQGTHFASGQEHAIAFIISHALIMGCIPFSGDLWESYIGLGSWTKLDTSVNALEKLVEQGDFLAKSAVKGAYTLGRRIAQLAIIIQNGLRNSREFLKEDHCFEFVLNKIMSNTGKEVAPND